jgi:thioredoxin-related protein
LNSRFILVIAVLQLSLASFAQNQPKIQWLDFRQLEDSLAMNPKKIFIDFYADWCAPCLKMQKDVFTKSAIIKELNLHYYAVKMNVESKDTIVFGSQVFINERIKKRNPVHQIPLLMAAQKNKPFSLPALIFLDENFKATTGYFQYLNTNQFLEILVSENNRID